MIYLLLPAYNEEKSLDNLLGKVTGYIGGELGLEYRVIVCDDGSTDGTARKLGEWEQRLPLTVITHRINRGLGETIRDLFEYAAEHAADDDVIVRMDCDDTHEPQFIKGLLDKIDEGCDVVIASRFVEGGGERGLDWYRTFISHMAQRFMRIMFPIRGLKEYSSGYRAYRATIVKQAVRTYGNAFIQLKGLGFTCTLEKVVKLKMLGARFGEAPFVLKYDQKVSESKMVSSITTFGYFTLALLYHWPWGGWKSQARNRTGIFSGK